MIELIRRLARPKAKLNGLTVTVYSRAQCCCCHTAIDLIEGYRKAHGFAVEVVDVDGDPALVEAHGLSVPVVAVGGKVRFRGAVNPVLFERLLAAEGEARRA